MTVKVILLKSGEDVISDAREILDREQNGIIAYHMTNPYIMQLTTKTEGDDGPGIDGETIDSPKTTFTVRYTNWAPLSKDREFIIPADWVVTIYDPHDNVLRDYCKKHNIEIEQDERDQTSAA